MAGHSAKALSTARGRYHSGTAFILHEGYVKMLSRSIIVPGTLLVLVAVAAVAHNGPSGQADAAVEMLARVPHQGDLRVLVWNVQRGANGFTRGSAKTLAGVRSVQADVVLLQESYDIDGGPPTLGRWLVTELGWKAWQGGSRHLCVLTRFEIEETFFHHDWHGVGARIVEDQGRALVVYSTWIAPAVYMLYHLREEGDVSGESVLKDEAGRVRAAATGNGDPRTPGASGHMAVLVGGDWNSPSHLDWTVDAAKVFRFRWALDLPVSRAMSDAGFADAFRELHRDPVQTPGITWSALFRETADKPETADRVDRLYIHQPAGEGRLRPIAATVIPLVLEDASVSQAGRVFPSDYGGIVVDLKWQ